MEDGTGDIIHRDGPYNETLTTYRTDLSLTTGMYTLTILDEERDG